MSDDRSDLIRQEEEMSTVTGVARLLGVRAERAANRARLALARAL